MDDETQGFEVFKKKVELPAYQLKHVAHMRFEKWRDERPVRACLVDCEVFKTTFLCRFLQLELREQNLLEFINLRQGSMSVKNYSLKFFHISKYALALVEKSRARMNKFVMGMPDWVEK